MAHNLLRAAGALASLPYAKARAATIRRDLIAVAARTAWQAAAASPCTCPTAGTASTNGPACSPRPAARPLQRPDQPRRGPRPTAVMATRTPAPEQEPRPSRRTGERQEAHARIYPEKPLGQESGQKRPTGIGRWIEAKWH